MPTLSREPSKSKPVTDMITSKPKQYVVQVPLTETVKPALAPVGPIAAKMTSGRDGDDPSRPKPVRQHSQREIADAARQQARRERERALEEELARKPSRRDRDATTAAPNRNDNITITKPKPTTPATPTTPSPVRKPVPRDAFKDIRTTNATTSKPTTAAPPAVTRPDPRRNESKPAVATTTRPPAAVTRPSAETTRQAPIVRSGSGGAAAARPTQPRTPTDNARPSVARQASQTRTPGRRI